MRYQTAFVFPGQGSQTIGMLDDFYHRYAIVRQLFQEAANTLGYDLWKLIQHGPEEELNQTKFTQPALLTASVAIWRVWQQHGGFQPQILAGHSLGEYTALVCAEALTFTEAVSLVAERGRLMQSAVATTEGAMAAILGLADEVVIAICKEAAAGQVVQPANFNSIGQIVIAGEKVAVVRAMELAKAAGAKRTLLLPVSVPSHCVLMQPIAEQFADLLANIQWTPPKIPVIHNFDLKMHQDVQQICYALEQQLYNPVRWVETIQHCADLGVQSVIECGPGKVLTGLNKRIKQNLECVAIGKVKALEEASNLVIASEVS